MNTSTTFYFFPYIFCIIPSLLFISFLKTLVKPPNASRPPPSLPTFPIIGYLHLLTTSTLPKSFQTLVAHYDPLMQFRLGSSTCIVVSNVTIAKQVMETHELAFASRLEFGSSDHFIYKGSKFIMAEYGPYWRFMKKLCLTKLLVVPTLDRFKHIVENKENWEKNLCLSHSP